MISLYSGTPGSGKSYHATRDIYDWLRYKGGNVIANFPIKPIKKQKGIFVYKSNDDLTIDFLVEFAKANHRPHKENESLLVIDEAGLKFNARCWNDKGRLQWLDFFSQHRKFGYQIILISQADLMLDKQIRAFIEVEHVHRKMALNGRVGFLLSPLYTFVDIQYWYGLRLYLRMEFIRYSRRIANIYDSYMMFDNKNESN